MPPRKKTTQPSTNGRPVMDIITVNRMERMVENLNTSISRLSNATLFDDKRNIDKECGYPEQDALDPEGYKKLYDRESIANRVVEVLPRECWLVNPEVYENPDRDPNNRTEFELAWAAVADKLDGDSWFKDEDEQGHPLWEYLLKLDILSGIGTFGIMLIGIDDGKELSEPIDGIDPDGIKSVKDKLDSKDETTDQDQDEQIDPDEEVLRNIEEIEQGDDLESDGQDSADPYSRGRQRKQESTWEGKYELLYLRVFDESQVQVTEREQERKSPRFGQPKRYLIQFDDPKTFVGTTAGVDLSTREVHWTRVIHVADNWGTNQAFGRPRMLPVLNRLLDLRKVYGSDAEAWWKAVVFLLSLETHPQLGGDVTLDVDDLKDQLENVFEGLQRYLASSGIQAKAISPAISDPTPHIQVQIESICIQTGIPVRIFMGSERGELASSQDDSTWNERLDCRCRDHVTKRIIVPFINRLIMIGVLPPPEHYCVSWPSRDNLTDAEQADVALKRTQALAQYVSGNVEAVIPPLEFWVMIMGFTLEDAQEIVDAMEEQAVQDRMTPDPEQGRIDSLDLEQQKLDGVKDGDLPPEIFQPQQPKPPFGGKGQPPEGGNGEKKPGQNPFAKKKEEPEDATA